MGNGASNKSDNLSVRESITLKDRVSINHTSYVRMSTSSPTATSLPSDKTQKLTITCILLCELFRNTANRALVYWVPLMLRANDNIDKYG